MTHPADEPESPCVRNCCLDDADICIGCGRHVQEIMRWSNAGAEERRAILARAAARREARRPRVFRPPGPT